ncbi:hypothetical protein ACLMJK_008004 [Lecanora helva]
MYGDHQYGRRESRPLSFVPSSPPESDHRPRQAPRGGPSPPQSLRNARNSLVRSISSERAPTAAQVNGQGVSMPSRKNSGDSEGGQLSPSGSIHRSNSNTANSQFPLNDIDYESSPNAVAQELNNLAALRRMSMDVNASGDPDLPSFSSNIGIPTAPPLNDDPDDRARLYWVPASVHPELAPVEFKTFLDKKVKSLKRKSDDKALASDSLSPGGLSGSLRRRKSMLSRQIDNSGGRGAEGYLDGAERLERKRSQSGDEMLKSGIQNLQELEVLVNEPEKVMQRLSLENGPDRTSGETQPDEDMPILPAIPGANSLRRSTRTTYRRGGSLRKGERGPFSKRGAAKTDDSQDSPAPSPITPAGEAFSLSRVQTEPAQPSDRILENFSRPNRTNRRQGMVSPPLHSSSFEEPPARSSPDLRHQPGQEAQPKRFVSQIASNGRLGVTPESLGKGIPHIVETPPPPEDQRSTSRQGHVPERSSSHEPPPSHISSPASTTAPPPARSPIRQAQSRTNQTVKSNQTLNDMTSHPSPLPGNNTRTDSLSFIPTLTEDKKSAESRKAKEKAEKEGSDSSRKSSWSWGSILGNEEKEREKKKAEEAKQEARKVAKSRLGKPAEKSHDNTRLDLLQTTMEGSRGRESLVLDRGDLKLEEERKKESSRKSGGADGKKEKESGIFSSIFGGGKKKGERDSTGKKHLSRTLSPEPPARILKPDIDYNWTRFSILEERAIYRMAHIKLANPRRALHSQVLLSNFMYSYLAKVQQMHPQAQLPQSPAQRAQQNQQKKDQPEEFSQYQKYQESKQQRRQQEQEEAQSHSSTTSQQAPTLAPVQSHDSGSFMDMDYDYDQYDHDGGQDGGHDSRQDPMHRPQSRTSQRAGETNHNYAHGNQHRRQHQQQHHSYNPQQISPYQYQQSQFDEPGRSSDDDMW